MKYRYTDCTCIFEHWTDYISMFIFMYLAIRGFFSLLPIIDELLKKIFK